MEDRAMGLPRMTTRRWMVAVAGVALLIGGQFEFVRLKRLSREYAGRAINATQALEYAQISAGWSHERWLAECREIDWKQGQWSVFQLPRPFPPDIARARVDHWESIRSKYDWATRYPWLPVDPDPPAPERIRSGASGE
jgi:hypothetical protein